MGKSEAVKKILSTYARIAPSKYGVGVVAIRDIPKGTDPFMGPRKQKWFRANMKDFKHADREIIKMIDDFYIVQKNGDVWVNEDGLNGLHLRWFLNHSTKPNLFTTDEALSFKAIRKIKKGEPLTYDYRTVDWKWRDPSYKGISK